MRERERERERERQTDRQRETERERERCDRELCPVARSVTRENDIFREIIYDKGDHFFGETQSVSRLALFCLESMVGLGTAMIGKYNRSFVRIYNQLFRLLNLD